MSRELEIEVDSASVERVRADLAAVPLFTEDRPLRGGVGRADWRLCGRLSELVASGRLAGERVVYAGQGVDASLKSFRTIEPRSKMRRLQW